MYVLPLHDVLPILVALPPCRGNRRHVETAGLLFAIASDEWDRRPLAEEPCDGTDTRRRQAELLGDSRGGIERGERGFRHDPPTLDEPPRSWDTSCLCGDNGVTRRRVDAGAQLAEGREH